MMTLGQLSWDLDLPLLRALNGTFYELQNFFLFAIFSYTTYNKKYIQYIYNVYT